MKNLLQKYKLIIPYLFFGILTTLINIMVYGICYHNIGLENIISNIIAWILAVIFAFITNKIYVFKSTSVHKNIILPELISFFMCRLLTGLMDLTIMYVFVDILLLNSLTTKIISNIIVIIVNYCTSNLITFKIRRNNT